MVTNYIKGASYKEIYDLHTDSESTSILTLHSPITNLPRQMLGGFFKQYRKFRYRGAKVTLRPASTLPADPEGISYEAGEPGIDPRDMLNPILTRGYCGDSLGTFLNTFMAPGAQNVRRQDTVGGTRTTVVTDGFTGSSLDRTSFEDSLVHGDWRSWYLEKLYYQSMSDPGFRKIKMQRSYSRFFRPLTYELATTVQYLAKPQTSGLVQREIATSSNVGTALAAASRRENNADAHTEEVDYLHDTLSLNPRNAVANVYGYPSGDTNNLVAQRITTPVLTSNKRPLGWLDTDTVVNTPGNVQDYILRTWGTSYSDSMPIESVPSALFGPQMENTVLPLINMGVFIFPKAYKQEMYYRMTISHVFDFKDYRPLKGLVSPFDNSAILGGSLEWADWDDNQLVYPGSSVTSTSSNFDLVDVVGSSGADETS